MFLTSRSKLEVERAPHLYVIVMECSNEECKMQCFLIESNSTKTLFLGWELMTYDFFC